MEHESTNKIVLERENNSEIKTQVEQDSHFNNVDFANLTSARNNLLEESKEITTKRTTDFNNPNFLASLSYKQDSLAEELESLRETIIKMQEEIKTLSNNYTQLKSEPVKVNKFDPLKKNDLLKSKILKEKLLDYATTTPNKAERNLKTKKSEVTAPKTPLSKTTINLKPENPEDKFNNERMYKTAKSNIKDLKKTQTDKSVVRKFDKKADDAVLKKNKTEEHSTTVSTDAKEKNKEKVSLLTRIKKPLNGGAKALKDKISTENESKKYLTEKRPSQNVRLSLHEKLKEGDEEKSRKGTNKEIGKHLHVSKKNIKSEKSKGEIENKKKEEKVDHLASKSNVELNINPFNDQPKNVESDLINESVAAMAIEFHVEVKEKNHEDEIKSEIFTNEVMINLEEESPLEIKNENITNEVNINYNLEENTQEEIKSDNFNLESEVVINLEENISALEGNLITPEPKVTEEVEN